MENIKKCDYFFQETKKIKLSHYWGYVLRY